MCIVIDLQQCASLLKSAAGVYSYLNDEVLPSLQPILPPERPAEATTTLSSIMALMCLAEAQVSDIVSFIQNLIYVATSSFSVYPLLSAH